MMHIALFCLFFAAGFVLGYAIFGNGPVVMSKVYIKMPQPEVKETKFPTNRIKEQVKLAKERSKKLMDV